MESEKLDQILERLDRLERRFRAEYPAWLTVAEVAQYLGVSPSTIRKLVANGSIPYRRLPTGEGGAIRFNRKMIDLWLLSGQLKPSKRTRLTFEEII